MCCILYAQTLSGKIVVPGEGGAWRLSWPRCLECNRPLSAMMRSDARWCSPRCRQRAYRRTTRQRRGGTACRWCGEWLPRSKRSDARYCSSACRGRHWAHSYEDRLEQLRRDLRALKPHDSRLEAKRVFDTLLGSSRTRRSIDQLVRVGFLHPGLWYPSPRIRDATWALLHPDPLAFEDHEHAGGGQG
jgi:hypothetical protein